MAKGQVPHNKKVDRDKLLAMLEDGASRAALEAEFGVQSETIRHIIRNELKRPEFLIQPGMQRRKNALDYETIERLLRAGKSLREVSLETGSPCKSISRARKLLKLEVGKMQQPHPPETHKRALEMLEDGASYNEVARTLKVGDKWVRRHYPNMGWTQEQVNEYNRAKRHAKEAGVQI